MPKYLLQANYAGDGIKGGLNDGYQSERKRPGSYLKLLVGRSNHSIMPSERRICTLSPTSRTALRLPVFH